MAYGTRTGRKARIYLTLRKPAAELASMSDLDRTFHGNVETPCETCNRQHETLWRITRATYETGLYWPAANINGRRQLLDGSLPETVDRLPRDAVQLSPEQTHRVWTEDNESHTFGGPNVAKALRETIAAHNAS